MAARRTATLLMCGLFLGVSTGAAQRVQVDVTGASVRFDSANAVSSASLTPTLEWRSRSIFANLTGTGTLFDGQGSSLQGRADGSYFFAPGTRDPRLAVELLGALSGTYHSSGSRTGLMRFEPRLHWLRHNVGGWIGGVASAGWTSIDREFVRGWGPTAGVWARDGRTRGAVTFTPLRIEGYWFPEVNAYLAVTAGPVDAVAYTGWRSAPAASGLDDAVWGGGTAAFWLNNRLAVSAAVGSYGGDLLQGLPSGRFITIGLRWTTVRPTIPVLRPLGRPVYERATGGALRLRFRVQDAASVAIAGEWTDWRLVPMTRDGDDSWEIDVRLPSGVYRFNLVVDGQRWIVPPGVPAVDDGFGGKAGLLLVP